MASLPDGHRWFADEHKRLLAAQAKLTERLNRLIDENGKHRPQDPN